MSGFYYINKKGNTLKTSVQYDMLNINGKLNFYVCFGQYRHFCFQFETFYLHSKNVCGQTHLRKTVGWKRA